MVATAASATNGWCYGGQPPPKMLASSRKGGALGDVLPTNIRQGLAAMASASKEVRMLTQAASDSGAKILGLHVNAMNDKGIVIDLIIGRGGVHEQRQFTLAMLSSQLLKQLILKAVEDGAPTLLIEPASMFRDAGLLAMAQTPLADQLVSDHLKVARHDGH